MRKSGAAARMGSMKTAAGDLKYAVRAGNLSPRHQVAVQHFRHPEVRVIGYRELAQDAKGVVWTTEGGVALRPRGARPPEGWFDLVRAQLPLALERRDNVLYCPHLVNVTDPHDPRAPNGLELRIAAGPVTFLVCAACIRSQFGAEQPGMLAVIGRYAIGLDAARDITVRPTGTPRTCVHDGACAWTRHLPDLGDRTLDKYRSGALPEGLLLDKIEPKWQDAVTTAGERLLIAGPYCYADDEDALLDALDIDPGTREATKRFLAAGPRVLFAKDRTLNQVLEACWDAAPKILADLHPDHDALAALLERHKRSPPGTILDEVLEARRAAAAMKGYPVYTTLPEPARVADRIARASRVGASSAMVNAVDQELKRASHKGLLWAALLQADSTAGRDWQFNKNDQEAGEFLREPLQALLDAGPDAYHASLARIHTLAGGAGDLPLPQGKAAGA